MGLLRWLWHGNDCGEVFAAAVDGMPHVGQGDGWTESSWRRAPRKTVRVADLVATNRGGYLDAARVARYAERAPGGEPCVVEHDGRYYVADGHHRAAAAIARGDKTIQVLVKRGGDR